MVVGEHDAVAGKMREVRGVHNAERWLLEGNIVVAQIIGDDEQDRGLVRLCA